MKGRATQLLAVLTLVGCAADHQRDDDGGTADGGNDGDTELCLPERLRNTCIEELETDYVRTCVDGFDGAGTCSWTETESGGVTLLKWENGAMIRGAGGNTEIFTASHHLCQIERGNCVHVYLESGWYRTCADRDTDDNITALHYSCDSGQKVTLTTQELETSCDDDDSDDPTGSVDCVDAIGRRYGDSLGVSCPFNECAVGLECHPNGTRDIPGRDGCSSCECLYGFARCTQGPCGREIGARCLNDWPCKSGLTCRDRSENSEALFGVCTVGCDDTACPDGTVCVATQKLTATDPEQTCRRPCTTQADCDPYWSVCVKYAGEGYCE